MIVFTCSIACTYILFLCVTYIFTLHNIQECSLLLNFVSCVHKFITILHCKCITYAATQCGTWSAGKTFNIYTIKRVCIFSSLQLLLWPEVAGVTTLLLATVVCTWMQPSVAPIGKRIDQN